MEKIELSSISKVFGHETANPVKAIDGLDLVIPAGCFYCLLGPSGCGKSTVLNMVAGFEQPTSGSVYLDEKIVSRPGPDRAVVFQQPTLYPWLTVRNNISLGPTLAGAPKDETDTLTMEYVRNMGLTGFEDRYPYELSGGMQQRVALARAWINKPRVLLLDEPFGALDAQTKIAMQELLLDLWDKIHTTILFITHDVDEAIFLGDRIGVMTGRPSTLCADLEVDIPRPRALAQTTEADFIGLKKKIINLLHIE